MRRIITRTLLAIIALIAIGLWVTRPQALAPGTLSGIEGDVARGEIIYAAMGCASCHMAPGSEDRLVLSGGKSFPSDFGTFYAPNISTDPDHGIGNWSDAEIASAVLKGTSPAGQHYYPAFPYASYGRAEVGDVVDLIAYLRTLPADQSPSLPHDVGFPFNIRASLGGWKLLFGGSDWVVTGTLTDDQIRGRMLVEGLGHCGECHTPRNALGGMDTAQWLAGAPIPGKDNERTPDIRAPSLDWSAPDIVAYLKTGLTPEFDSAGGEMVDVIANMKQLPDDDLNAIAAYLLIVGTDTP